jgi:transposase
LGATMHFEHSGLVHRHFDTKIIGFVIGLHAVAVHPMPDACAIGEKRRVKTRLKFFRWFGEERSAKLEYVCSDMWKPYLKVIRKKAPKALHVLDRFHIMAHMNKAIDEVRAGESRKLVAKGFEPVLKGSRGCFLKRPENLTEKQDEKLADVLQYNLRTVRSYLLKEEFQFFWEYQSPAWGGKFMDQWCTKTMRSKIEPMKKVAKMLRRHRELIWKSCLS